ncbi:MAG: prenyltransferase [Acidimicrobiia bacterium]|nr:prenyltransferase [Acidimicrobiia bacterium]
MTDAVVGARESLPKKWLYVLATTNPPKGTLDPVSKWLWLTRAGVLPMTLVAAGLGGLLAAFRDADVDWALFTVAAVGLVLSHMANNIMNDLFDLEVGTDTKDYPRNLYSPHPVISGVVTRKRLAVYGLVVNVMCLAVMIFLTAERGPAILGFALGGFFLSAAYTAPPVRLKKHGLGEPTVVVVWGPLMVGGVYYAATGSIPAAVLLASLPYAILCTTVLMGKHIDKAPWDGPAGTRTLPVILGDAPARQVTRGMFVAFYAVVVGLVIARVLPVATVLIFASLPLMVRVWKVYGAPKPAESPMPNPVWPLWFAPHSFLVTRRAGGLLILGMIIGVIVGW